MAFANLMVYGDRLAMVELLPAKNEPSSEKPIQQIGILMQLRFLGVLTISVSKTPAAKMKIVCENCCTMPPQTKPTMPNNVIMMRDNFSARPCPSKSCKSLFSLVFISIDSKL